MEFRFFSLTSAGEYGFFEHVFADDAEVDHAVHDETGNVVVAHAQDLNGHIFRYGQKALGVEAYLETAAFKKVLRVVGKSPGLLHCKPQAVVFSHFLLFFREMG